MAGRCQVSSSGKSGLSRFKPGFMAAPFGPPILPPVASNVWRISALSESRSVVGAAGSDSLDNVPVKVRPALGNPHAGSEFGSTPSWAAITARSVPAHAPAENIGEVVQEG
jgi:hypothetical protein